MVARSYEGVFVALLPQRGAELIDVLREASRQFLSDRDPRKWSIEFSPMRTPAGAVAFRLVSGDDQFPWRDSAAELAKLVSQLGPGRCWALAMEKTQAGVAGWGEGLAYDRGDRVAYEESTPTASGADLLAWFGEQLALSENEVLALFESCDQAAGLTGGGEKFEDEIDQILDRARREFQRYRELKEARERGGAGGPVTK